MGEPYLWRTANMSPRTFVVVEQMQSNLVLCEYSDLSIRMGNSPVLCNALFPQI